MLSPQAGLAEIKSAYRRLSMQYHPDVCSLPDAHERFLEITIAYENILKKRELDEALRKRKAVHEETAQEIIDAWLKSENERMRKRANKHAEMRFYNFKKSKLFKSSFVMPKSIIYASLFFGTFVVIGSLYGTWHQYVEDKRLVNANYIGSAIIVFLMGVVMISFAGNRWAEQRKWMRRK